MAYYGAREQNWIEVKAFLSSIRTSSALPKTRNAGRILRDLLRLCLLPEELPGRIRQNGRYFVLVTASPPAYSLPVQKRSWLSSLLSAGIQDLSIDLTKEPQTLHSAVGVGFIKQPELQVALKVKTLVCEPEFTDATPTPVFWGYLVRILEYSVTTLGKCVTYQDAPENYWNSERVDDLKAVQASIISRF